MTGMAEDVDALFDLIEKEAGDLEEQDPEHELLEFVGPALYERIWTRGVHERFLERFDTEKGLSVTQIRVAFLVALREATGNTPTRNEPSSDDEPEETTESNGQEGFGGYDAGEIPF